MEIDRSGDRLRNMAQLDRRNWLSKKLAQIYRPAVDVCVSGLRVANFKHVMTSTPVFRSFFPFFVLLTHFS